MDFKSAFEILEIDFDKIGYNQITLAFLKKKYYKLALQNHPDKNPSLESKEKFQKLNEAYQYLVEKMDFQEEGEFFSPSASDSSNSKSESNQYLYFLSMFLQNILQGHSIEIINSISNIIKNIVIGCQKVTVQWFEELDKETSIQIYEFLSQYRNTLYIQQDILTLMREIILEKHKKDQVYILNPSIDDLLDQNIYKLVIEDEIYFVPLWHINSDILFDKVEKNEEKERKDYNNNDNDEEEVSKERNKESKESKESKEEIIVRCVPELPENMWIDEMENIHIQTIINSQEFSLFNEKSIPITLGKKTIDIPIHELFIRRTQTYILKGQGISKITNNLGEEINNFDLNNNLSNSCFNKKNIIIHIDIQ